VTVKVKYADFRRITRGRSRAEPIASQAMLEEIGIELLRPLFPPVLGVRLLGVTLSNLDATTQPVRAQLALVLDPAAPGGAPPSG
jgi:DNA polymerase IV